MNIDGEERSQDNPAEERRKEIQEHIIEEEQELKELDDEIQEAIRKSKKVIRDAEP